jgi:NAD(P)-dependent dehydrogenase (short-subunit alcohol dehydrogenase family)
VRGSSNAASLDAEHVSPERVDPAHQNATFVAVGPRASLVSSVLRSRGETAVVPRQVALRKACQAGSELSVTQLLTGRTAVVTGGAGAIGSAVCQALAAHGARVHCVDLVHEGAAAVAGAITSSGGNAVAHVCDMSDRESVLDLFEQMAADGGFEVLVNTAAWIQYRDITDFDEATVDRMLAVGLKASMWTIQASARAMPAGGSIVNFSSTTSLRTSPGHFVYAALKGAINTMTMQAAVELGPRGIRVNAIAPGLVLHDGNRPRLSEEFIDLHHRTTPLGRIGEPEDIAAAVVFFASDLSRWVSGITLPVDGGRLQAS